MQPLLPPSVPCKSRPFAQYNSAIVVSVLCGTVLIFTAFSPSTESTLFREVVYRHDPVSIASTAAKVPSAGPYDHEAHTAVMERQSRIGSQIPSSGSSHAEMHPQQPELLLQQLPTLTLDGTVLSTAYSMVRLLLLPFGAGALFAYLLFKARAVPQWQMIAVDSNSESVQQIVVESPAAAPMEEVEEEDTSPIDDVFTSLEPQLCCPTCLKPLMGSFCATCSLEYEDTGVYLNLTPASGRPLQSEWEAPTTQESPFMQLPFMKEALPVIEQLEKAAPQQANVPKLSRIIKGGYQGDRGQWGTSTFESPIVSGVYERGWRQSFARAGFPGPDAEFAQALDWLLPVAKGKAILDASCGSGIFTRRFLECGEFSKVFALDYSDSMLNETRQGIDREAGLQQKAIDLDLELVRADIARMPFASESLDAIHAGAAIHCWPQPSLAVSEIARVLKPGGRVVMSTFLVPGQDVPFLDETLRAAFVTPQVTQGMKYWEESELRDLCSSVGLVNFEVERKQDFIIFKVERPRS